LQARWSRAPGVAFEEIVCVSNARRETGFLPDRRGNGRLGRRRALRRGLPATQEGEEESDTDDQEKSETCQPVDPTVLPLVIAMLTDHQQRQAEGEPEHASPKNPLLKHEQKRDEGAEKNAGGPDGSPVNRCGASVGRDR